MQCGNYHGNIDLPLPMMAGAEILANIYRKGGSLSLTGEEEREYVGDIAKEVCVCAPLSLSGSPCC